MRKPVLSLVILCACLAAPGSPVLAGPKARKATAVAGAQEDGGPNVIESVSVQGSGKFAKVVIQSTRPLKAREIAPADGMSISLYMTEPTLCRRPPIEKGTGDLVEEIRFAYQGAKIPSDKPLPLDTVTLRMTEPVTYAISQREWVYQVELRARGVSPAASGPGAEEAEESHPLSSGKKGEKAVLPPNPGVEDFLKTGLANYEPLHLAEEEYNLAQLRRFEAVRGLFPSATAKFEKSQGSLLKDIAVSTDDIHFIRRSYGVELGQPIFRSGKLYYSWRQTAWQAKAAAQNVKKVRGEVTFEIIKAYNNLIKSQRALKVRRELMERMDKVIELTRKKRQLELITESDALGTESQYNQAYYRLLSDEKELEIARLKMESLLNISEPLPAVLPESDETFDPNRLVDLNVPVETFVEAGFKHRPEMLNADYAATANAYGEKAARADGRLQIDASGFIGKAGGAFTEDTNNPFSYKTSWNAGIQASMFFFGNSLKGMRSRDRTAPDYGETTATNTDATTASVGLLDGLKTVGDGRQARIARERAYYERDQARRNVEVDVREAYYNIQKARIQLKGAKVEVEYRQKELGISRQKERMNLIDPPQAMQAEVSYADAVNGWEEAVSFYKVSLANLAKAVGEPLDSIVELKK